ncbi:MAG: FAD-dependent oxidoreductase [Pseudomonadota bacterium]
MLRVVANDQHSAELPVAIIGAGPIGLAAAANLVERGITPLILEAGETVAASIRDWGHVRFFTPWSYLVDPAGQRLLEEHSDWEMLEEDYVPLASEFLDGYLDRLAALEFIAPHVRLQHKVVAVTRIGHDRMKDGEREAAPFLIVAHSPEGAVRYRASAVIDASGTWTTPNPLGAAGVLADGEEELSEFIRYGIPDIAGGERHRYEGKRVLVVGSGHSAIGSVLELAALSSENKQTQVAWAVRKTDPSTLWGGGSSDELKERGALGMKVHEAVHSGLVTLLQGLSISALRREAHGIVVADVEGQDQVMVDEIIVATGSRPDLDMLRELRLDLDVPTESTRALGPLVDPNHHSCGSVPPHGVEELKHPETGFFMVGMKSYGRAPTFLARTGYEQVRSVVAELDGDHEAAHSVELTLPQTGVCSSDLAYGGKGSGGCC